MDLFADTRAVERPRFFDGQQLFASDLDGIAALHRAMRWLHNRSLHQPGIGNGFAVAGRRGDRTVRIQPGYALDRDGREIVLLDSQEEPVPPVASEHDGGPVFFDLTVAYPADEDLEESETREGVCLPRGVVRLRERPVFCWVRLQRDPFGELRPVSDAQALEIQQAVKIVLARAQVRECALDADLVTSLRRNARPPQVPAIACGCVTAEWEPWRVDDASGGGDPLEVGLLARIDTGAAFNAPPCFTARVCGPRPLSVDVPGGFESVAATVAVLDLPAYVIGEDRAGFTCHVALCPLGEGLTAELLDATVPVARRAWRVQWMAIED